MRGPMTSNTQGADTSRIQIGAFTLIDSPTSTEGSIWIEKPDGEGGEFSIVKLEAVIRGFFDEHF